MRPQRAASALGRQNNESERKQRIQVPQGGDAPRRGLALGRAERMGRSLPGRAGPRSPFQASPLGTSGAVSREGLQEGQGWSYRAGRPVRRPRQEPPGGGGGGGVWGWRYGAVGLNTRGRGGASKDNASVFGLGSCMGNRAILWKANMLLGQWDRLGSEPRILF